MGRGKRPFSSYLAKTIYILYFSLGNLHDFLTVPVCLYCVYPTSPPKLTTLVTAYYPKLSNAAHEMPPKPHFSTQNDRVKRHLSNMHKKISP